MPVTPWVYLSSLGPGTGQRAATSAASKPMMSVAAGRGRCRPVRRGRNHPGRERVSGRRRSRSARRARAGRRWRRSARRRRWECRRRPPGCGLVDGGEHLGAVGPQRAEPEMPTTPSITRSVVAGTLSPPDPPAFGTPPAPSGVCVPGLSSTAAADAHGGAGTSPPTARHRRCRRSRRPRRPTGLRHRRCHQSSRAIAVASRSPPAASAHRRAATPAAALRLRGSHRRCSSTASVTGFHAARAPYMSPPLNSQVSNR